MIDNTRALELIEDAERATPFCPCGEPTVPVGRPGSVWLECVSLQRREGTLRRLLRLDFAVGHTDRRIVDLSTLEVAA